MIFCCCGKGTFYILDIYLYDYYTWDDGTFGYYETYQRVLYFLPVVAPIPVIPPDHFYDGRVSGGHLVSHYSRNATAYFPPSDYIIPSGFEKVGVLSIFYNLGIFYWSQKAPTPDSPIHVFIDVSPVSLLKSHGFIS